MNVAHLEPEHYEPRPLPAEIAAYGSVPEMLPTGSPGKVAILDLRFASIGGRTELVERYQRSPLQVIRPLYYDPSRPDMAIVLMMSAGAGMVQGDRYRVDVDCGAGSALHLTTQGSTKVMQMEHDYATSVVNLTAGEGSLLEYLPDPIIPCAGSRSYHRTRVTIGAGTTAFVGETIRAGRLAHGERHVYDILATDLEILRPDGTPLVLDRVRLSPGLSADGISGPGVLGGDDQVAALHVVSEAAPAAVLADTMRAALAGVDLRWGVSVLPGDCGAWVRMLGSDSPVLDRAMRDVWDAARRLLIGVPAPRMRKSTTYLN